MGGDLCVQVPGSCQTGASQKLVDIVCVPKRIEATVWRVASGAAHRCEKSRGTQSCAVESADFFAMGNSLTTRLELTEIGFRLKGRYFLGNCCSNVNLTPFFVT